MKNKNYEVEVPEGYKVAKVIDAANTKFGVLMNVFAGVIGIVLMGIFILIYRKDYKEFSFDYEVLIKFLIVMVCYILLTIIHELLHGLAYKILTKRKLKFGLTFTVAFCGVPDIYVYRKAAIISLLTPCVVISIASLIGIILVNDSAIRLGLIFLFSFHFGGCSGDLYGFLLYLFKFRDKTTLMNDTGPKQTFYVKE